MPNWKILIVDDEPEVHSITKMVLNGLTYKGKGLEIIDAFSAEEAISILEREEDVAAAVIDVVMETPDSGLQLAKSIRGSLGNSLIRLFLRTGQPGNAPKESVILEYDINDYREKTDLTAGKLITSIISCLRSYDDLCTIVQYKEHLEDLVAERTAALETANRELRYYNRVIESDLEAGSVMQYKLLPKRMEKIGGYRFSRYLLTSMYLSGDFVDYYPVSDDKICFYILDVSGHGTSSAFMTVIIKNFIDKQLEAFNTGNPSVIDKPLEMADYLNQELMRENYGKYFTMFYGIIDERENMLRYVNCGQFPYPVFSDTHAAGFFSSGGPAVGLFSGAEYTEEVLELPGAFQILFISDGILEYLDDVPLKARKERILSCVAGKAITINDAMDSFGISGNETFPDDITFLLIERTD